MEDKNISNDLRGVIVQMLKPLKGLKFSTVIEGISGKKVVKFNKNDHKDRKVLEVLKKVSEEVMQKVNEKGIHRNRPNEVGNDIEIYVKNTINQHTGFKADVPKTNNNKRKSTGYPDIIFQDKFGRWHYLECKTYNSKNINTTQRSFYLSPSEEFKVTMDAHHFGISFEIYSIKNNVYKIKSWKILDLSLLELDIKYEFNSDNKRLYDKKLILAESKKRTQ